MSRRWVGAALVLFAATALLAGTASAQVFTPTFQTPRSSSDMGIYVSDLGDLGLEGILRRNFGGYDLGGRVGLVDAGEDIALSLGGELRSPLRAGTAPIDLALTAGVQGILGDVQGFGFQGGLSVGHTFRGEGVNITPYVHPRLGLVDGPRHKDLDGDAELDVLLDLGFDLDFSQNLSLRFGANLGDGADWGLGLAWRR